MKRFSMVLAALMLSMTLVFVGCKKNDNNASSSTTTTTTSGGNSNGGVFVGNTCNGYEFVDMGFESKTLWATCNIGADTPEEWGNRYAWGETTIKGTSKYTWEYYKHCKGSRETLTKYNQGEQVGYQGYTDDLTELQPMDDAATVNWGKGWCMPTLAQIRELSTYTTWSWETTPNGVKGNRYTSKINGNSIFIPADADGHYATIWTKSLYAGINAWKFTQGGDTYGIDWTWRCDGIRVRPVCKR